MSKKTEKKMQVRIDDATRAIIGVLCSHERKHPGECMSKSALFPLAISRAEYEIAKGEDDIHDLEAIPSPDLRFFSNHWSKICKYSAARYEKYIIWDATHRTGIRLGTLEEYEKNQKDLAKIVGGIADYVEDRTRIIVSKGGQSFLINISVKLLGSGEDQP